MAVFKVKYMTAPGAGHVYVRVFSAPHAELTYAALGILTIRKGEEFTDFQRAFAGATFEEEDLSRV
jgi:hypothetical protein